MADNRCPMCGKLNPNGLDVCQYCEARLTPLIISDSPGDSADQNKETADLFERSSLGWEDEPDSEEPSTFEDESDASAWLDRISAGSEKLENISQEEGVGTSPGEDESVSEGEDWLQRIRSLHESSQEAETIQSSDEGGLESLSGFDADIARDEQEEPLEQQDVPDWLRRLDTPSPEKPETEPGEEGLPDWLSENIPSDSSDTADSPESIPQTQAEQREDEDWFSHLGMGRDFDDAPDAGETASYSDFQEPGEDQPLPDWLSDSDYDLSSDVSDSPKEPDGQTHPGEGEGSLPELSSDSKLGTELVSDQVEDESGIDWVSEASEDEADIPLTRAEAGDVPDWLTNLGQDDSAPGDQDPERPELPVSVDGEDLEDWLSNLEEDTSLEEDSDREVSETGEEIPAWLKNLGSVVMGTVEDGGEEEETESPVSPFVAEEDFDEDFLDVDSLPEWLTPELEAKERATQQDSDLAPADLPGWLAAMRPVDEEIAGESVDDGVVVSAGPLAGLRSVIPAEPEITQFKKPSAYSAKIRITESQQNHVKVFQKLLASEGKSGPIPEPSLLSTQRALRWIIAFLLIIGIGSVVLGGSQVVPFPGINAISDTTMSASRIISAVPDQVPVLIAFDYEPGTSGEMHATAAALVDHMMLRGTRLALVSSLPTGPGMGEYFIQEVQREHSYISGQQYINLGYIPGGASGLLSFAQTPQWAIQQSYQGVNPWQSPLLSDVQTLSDFAVLVVITDNAEVARSWIEQVQPRIENTPLLMVVSAQIEPMVRPYYGEGLDRQVAGMISGITGGVAYEVIVGKANLGRTYWDAFNVALILVVAVIIFGGSINTIQFLLSRDKRKTGEGLE